MTSGKRALIVQVKCILEQNKASEIVRNLLHLMTKKFTGGSNIRMWRFVKCVYAYKPYYFGQVIFV